MHNRIAKIAFDEREAILYVTIHEEAVMDLESLQVHFAMIHEITGEREYVALIDATHWHTTDTSALEYVSTAGALRNRKAAAYCNSTALSRFHVMQLQIKLRSRILTEVFPRPELGLAWLRSIKNSPMV